ncbi:MAG: M55 family metallopeptidase [Candidatus Omnitrophica bacterium]|nr:M55 family metallopeptidase [Candidatus Omnitrophota bacterium]
MKVYISTDMEGVSGVVTFQQTGRDEKGEEYEKARHLLTADVNAAVEGALSAGAREIVVMDGHGGGHHFIIEELHPAGRYIIGPVRIQAIPKLDKSFDAMLLVGYHAMAGTRGAILDHTQSSTTWYNYFLNGIKMGEIGQEAVIAGHYGIPVVFVSGDKAACEEAQDLLGNIEVASVKEGLTRTCAEILPPVKARELIRAGVTRALKRLPEFKPYLIKTPIEIRLETQNTDVADGYESAGWKRIDGRAVTKIAQSALEIL